MRPETAHRSRHGALLAPTMLQETDAGLAFTHLLNVPERRGPSGPARPKRKVRAMGTHPGNPPVNLPE
jgi:hypothetical protein